MKFKSVLFLFLASIILFGFSQQTNAESQESNVTPSQESYAHDVLNEQLSSNLSTTDAIQQRAAYAPSTWYYTTYRSYVGYPHATIYVSVENTAVKRRSHGYLTLISTGYAPGNGEPTQNSLSSRRTLSYSIIFKSYRLISQAR